MWRRGRGLRRPGGLSDPTRPFRASARQYGPGGAVVVATGGSGCTARTAQAAAKWSNAQRMPYGTLPLTTPPTPQVGRTRKGNRRIRDRRSTIDVGRWEYARKYHLRANQESPVFMLFDDYEKQVGAVHAPPCTAAIDATHARVIIDEFEKQVGAWGLASCHPIPASGVPSTAPLCLSARGQHSVVRVTPLHPFPPLALRQVNYPAHVARYPPPNGTRSPSPTRK